MGGCGRAAERRLFSGHALEGMRYRPRAEQEVVDVIRTANFNEITASAEHLAEGIAVDRAVDGRIVGIEILDTRKRFGGPEVFRRVVLVD